MPYWYAALARCVCGRCLSQPIAPSLRHLAILATIVWAISASLNAQQVDLPESNSVDPIAVTAQAANRWQQGSYEVWLLRGDVRFQQGADKAECQEAVLWIDHAQENTRERTKITAYFEGNVGLRLSRQGAPVQIQDQKWIGRFYTIQAVQIRAGVVAGQPSVLPGIFYRGMELRDPKFPDTLQQTHVEQAQFVVPRAAPSPQAAVQGPPGTRRVRVFARGDVPMQAQSLLDPQSSQWTLTINQGVTVIVDGLAIRPTNVPGVGQGPLSLDISTDRLVVWTTTGPNNPGPNNPGDQSQGMQLYQNENQPLEIYMEGNVVFRQGDTTIYADRMYYDVRNKVGTILGADLLSPAPGYEGKVRLHADVMQQVGEGHFTAENMFVTSSRLGVPSYDLTSGQASYEDRQTPRLDPYTGQPLINPETGQPLVDHRQFVTASNNILHVEEVPVFFWPTIATDLNESSFFLRRIRFKQDGVFGTQLYTDFNGYQLFGIQNRPAGTDWDLSLNYLSKRGLSEGTEFIYNRNDIFGIQGPTSGLFDFWGISDKGTDNLGIDRPMVHPEPDVPYRYRLLAQHRQDFGEGVTFTGEIGKISDRNFLQEYFKQEWDELKDPTTDAEIKLRRENMSMSLFAGARLNSFVTETQWLPRFDHYLLGQSLFEDRLTWFEHTSLGYAQFKTATLPSAAAGDEAVSHLPWEAKNYSGGRLVTRNEIDLPVELGPVKIVPYLLGELGYWGDDVNGDQLTRAYYQAGIRATLPIWNTDSSAESALWNVHGLAHKVEFDAEYFHSEASRSVSQLPLYDPLDDNQIEDFRRRFTVNTFGFPAVPSPLTQGPPQKFDERFYAVRTDMQGWVTAPSMEIANDLDEVRLGIHQRWQTKRGPVDNRHIIDWIEFDTNVTLFPNAPRDNFGSGAGLVDYNFIWHVGDRLTVLSDGIFDFFGQGQKIATLGMFLTRPPRGALYAGLRVLDGPINSNVLYFSYSYWMSPKWISSAGVSIDLSDTKNIGQSLRITRVGESLLVGLDLNFDPARNSVGLNLAVEPRFVPKSGKLGQASGVHIGPAGEYGVE